jgi:hypothetical protein
MKTNKIIKTIIIRKIIELIELIEIIIIRKIIKIIKIKMSIIEIITFCWIQITIIPGNII